METLKRACMLMTSLALVFFLTNCGDPPKPEAPKPPQPVKEELKGYWAGTTGGSKIYVTEKIEQTTFDAPLLLLNDATRNYFGVVADNGQAAFLISRNPNNLFEGLDQQLIPLDKIWRAEADFAYLMLGEVQGDTFVGETYDMTKFNDGEVNSFTVVDGVHSVTMKNKISTKMQFLPTNKEIDMLVPAQNADGTPKLDPEGNPVLEMGKGQDTNFKESTNLQLKSFLDGFSAVIKADNVVRLSHKNTMSADGNSVTKQATLKNGKLKKGDIYNCSTYTDGPSISGSIGSLNQINFQMKENSILVHKRDTSPIASGINCAVTIVPTAIAETSVEGKNLAESMPSQYSVTVGVSDCLYGDFVNASDRLFDNKDVFDFKGIAVAFDRKLNIYTASKSINKPLVMLCTK